MNNNQFEQLIRQMQDRVKSDPANPDAWRDLAQAKMMAGDIDGAEDDCIECLRLNPQNVGGLILMGNLLTNCRKNDEAAIGYYEKAVAFGPKSPDAHCNLGTLYFKRGENIKALGQLRQAIELKSDHAVAYVMLAQCYAAMEDWRSAWITAKDAFDKCKITPENAALYNRLSAALQKVIVAAELHGGSNPPEEGQKAMEQALRQREFDMQHEGEGNANVKMMMSMYMLGAMERFDQMSPEKLKAVAVEIAMLGTQGISPDKHEGYKLKSIPGEDFSGYRMLAHYYVSWARVFPDKLSLLQLPFDDAYAAAKSMYEMKNRGNGDNSSKTTGGGGGNS